MKTIDKLIPKFQEDIFFSAIRDKRDFAKLLAISARNLLIDFTEFQTLEATCTMKLVVDKMSRMFYFKDGKYFSISFPFIVLISDGQVTEISTFTGKKVDNKSISAIISILEEEQFQLNPSLLDIYIASNDLSFIGIELLEEIFQSEPCYIRYDNDPTNENGNLHPLHHLDINYSSYGTYKVGLSDVIPIKNFEDVLNINTNCSFLNL